MGLHFSDGFNFDMFGHMKIYFSVLSVAVFTSRFFFGLTHGLHGVPP
jgi:hypothetical protein